MLRLLMSHAFWQSVSASGWAYIIGIVTAVVLFAVGISVFERINNEE